MPKKFVFYAVRLTTARRIGGADPNNCATLEAAKATALQIQKTYKQSDVLIEKWENDGQNNFRLLSGDLYGKNL